MRSSDSLSDFSVSWSYLVWTLLSRVETYLSVLRLPYVTRLYFRLPLTDVSPVIGTELAADGIGLSLLFGVEVE